MERRDTMRKSGANLLVTAESCLDSLINAVAVIVSYMCVLVFYEPLVLINSFPSMLGVFLLLLCSIFVYQCFDAYRSIPRIGRYYFVKSILKSNLFLFGAVALVLLLISSQEQKEFLMCWVALCAVFSTALLLFKKRLILNIVRILRRRDYNVRRVIIVGDNKESANAFIKQLSSEPEHGMIVIGAVGGTDGAGLLCDRLGDFDELADILDSYKPSDVVFAIDSYDKSKLISLVNMCDDRCIKVYFLPVIYGFFKSARQIEKIGDGMIINSHSTPLDNKFNAAVKRLIDIVGSIALIILTSPIMLITAIGVKMSSPGPIIFTQERVGKMGKPFKMLKFRSMRVTAEDSSDRWTTDQDERKTRFGNFIRRASVDELPQLFNVLAGSMSLVGPRPEVPRFVEHFKDVVPLYMIKHYVKPGITGLAQIRGLRGDTSVEDRIQADIAYIEGWSLGLDISILLKTPFKAFNSREKYIFSEMREGESDSDIVFDFSVMRSSNAPSAKDGIKASEPKRILYAASTMQHISNFHMDYIGALRGAGHTVKIMASGEGADYDIPFEKKFISLRNLRSQKEIRRILRSEHFDTIVLNTSLAAYHIRRACPLKNRPKVVNFVHGYLFSECVGRLKAFVLMLAERFLAGRTDDIIVMNLQDYRAAVRNNLCRDRVYFVKGMGAEVREMMFPPEEVRKRHGAEDKFILAFVGELSERKNQEFLIRAMARISVLIPGAVLWLIGGGTARAELEGLAAELGISDKVLFTGMRADACDYVRCADIYVSASRSEGMPFNVIEALGCGVTVLASNVKGHSDLIDNGTDGFLYLYNNMEDFITKVYKIQANVLAVSPQNVRAKYEKYAKGSVFPDTLAALSCAALSYERKGPNE